MNDTMSSSDDDFYDNFEKYKQKRKIHCKAGSPRVVPDITIPVRPVVQRTQDSDDHLSDCNENTAVTTERNKIPDDIDFDAEFADLPSVVTRIRSLRTKEDERLKSVLREARSTLDSIEHNPRLSSPILVEERIISSSSNAVLRKRCTLNLLNSKDGQSFIVRCNMDEPFKNVMENNAERLQIEASKIVFMGRDRRYYPDDTPLNVGLNEHSVHDVDVYENVESSKISLKWLLKGRKPIIMEIFPTRTFDDLKQQFCLEQNLDLSKTQLVFDSEKVCGTETPESLELEDGDCIDVYVNAN